MNNIVRRYLALNMVLNGHPFIDAWDSPEDAAEGLGMSPSEVIKMNGALCRLQDKRIEMSTPVRVALNFMRLEQYAFLDPGQGSPVFLSAFVSSDRDGEIPPDFREAVVMQLITDCAFVDKDADVRIADGCFYLPRSYQVGDTFACNMGMLKQTMMQAYNLYCNGPVKGGSVLKHRDALGLDWYKQFSAEQVCAIFRDFIKRGVSPLDYRDTTLHIPDLWVTYSHCGCVMAKSEVSPDTINWLLDVKDKNAAKVIPVADAAVQGLIIKSAWDLANIAYSAKETATGGLVSVAG